MMTFRVWRWRSIWVWDGHRDLLTKRAIDWVRVGGGVRVRGCIGVRDCRMGVISVAVIGSVGDLRREVG